MKGVVKHQYLQMSVIFSHLEVVYRGSETQLPNGWKLFIFVKLETKHSEILMSKYTSYFL